MASTQVSTLAGLQQSLILAEQRCDALQANLEACYQAKTKAKPHGAGALSSTSQFRLATGDSPKTTTVTPTNTIANADKKDDHPDRPYDGPPILPFLTNLPGEILKNKDEKRPKEVKSFDQPEGNSTLQKLQDLLLSFPGFRHIVSLPSKISRPATPSSVEIFEKDLQPPAQSFSDKTKQNQIIQCGETDCHTEKGYTTNITDDFLSADDRPPSSRQHIWSGSEDDFPENSPKEIVHTLPISAKTKVKRGHPDASPRRQQPQLTRASRGLRSDKALLTQCARRSQKEPDALTVCKNIEVPAEDSHPPKKEQCRGDCDEFEKVKPRNSVRPGYSDPPRIEQECSLLDEAFSTNQLVGESSEESPITFEPKVCSRSHSMVGERRSADIADTSVSIFDVLHSYERPTVSSQLKRVERRLSFHDIHKEIAGKKDHPFVVARATTPSHNVNLSSRECMGDIFRPTSRTNVKLSKCDYQSSLGHDTLTKQCDIEQIHRKQSKAESILELKQTPSTSTSITAFGYGSASIGGHQYEGSCQPQEDDWKGVNRSLPLRFSRQLHCVLERLRNEMIDLATKRAMAASNVPGTAFQHPLVLTPNTGIMQAKLKRSMRAGKTSQDTTNTEESIRAMEELDQKLQATEDEVYIIITLCQEVDRMREQLDALYRRVSLYSITNPPSSTKTQTEVQQSEIRRLRGSRTPRTPARRAAAQNCSRSKSAGLKS